MDFDGVDAEVLFPPQRTMLHFLGDEDDDFVLAGVGAYNDFMFDEFCAADPARLAPVAQIPSTGIDDAVETLRKAKARGAKAVVISCWPAGGDSISADDDAFWAAAVDEGLPVAAHGNITSRRAIQEARAAATKARPTYYGGQGHMPGAKAAASLSAVFGVAPASVAQLIFTGTFERFPDLHVSMIETGVGWIGHFLEQMDDRYWRNRSWSDVPITQPPSSYWHRNMSATYIADRAGVEQRHRIGVGNMMWSTDYPHHGNDWPHSRRVVDAAMAGVPREERHQIVAANAVRIFGLDR